MDKRQSSTPLDLKAVRITDSFWCSETVRTEVIPYQWEALNDRINSAEPSYCMHNFKAAKKKRNPAVLKFIPYFAWANRGEGEMRVWVRI